MFKRFLLAVLAALIGAATPAVPAQAPSPAIERGFSVSAPVALPQLAQRLPDTIPPLYMLGGDDSSSSLVASYNSATDPFPSAILSYSGPSLSTMFDSTGKLTYKPNNLLLNTATLGTQTVTVQVGVNYLLSIKGTGSVTLTGASTAGPLNGTGASNRVDLKITAATSSLTLTVSGSVTSARLSAVTYETAFRSQDDVDNAASAYYGPRIDYDPNTLAVKGLLIEEARTNYAVQSTGLTTASWNLQNATRAVGTTSPDGTANALTLTSSGGTIAQLYQGLTGAPTGTVTNSVFVKAGTSPYIWLQVFDNVTSSTVYVRTSDMTITSTTGGATSSITMLSNGWYRLTIGRTIAVAGAYLAFGVADASGSTVSTAAYTGLFYGPDHEAGSFATSYIPTAAASVTRAADVVQFTGPALTALQGAAASILVEVEGVSVYSEIVGSNQLRMQVDPANPYYNGYYAPDNLIITPSAGALSTTFRAGSAWSASGKRAALNGLALASSGNAATPITGAVTLGFAFGTFYINSWVKSFAIYNQRLPDATLQAKSTVGASYAANDNGIRYAFADNDNLPIHWRVAL